MRLADLQGRHTVIWGGGRECASVRAAAERLGVFLNLTVLDESDPAVDVRAVLSTADALVKSPGVSRYREELQELRQRGVPITTATNLWFSEHPGKVIAVTGTKGKSTTSSLIAALLSAAGIENQLAGNIGRSPIEYLGTVDPQWWVLELSSFQTSDLETSPDIAVLTTFSPEHLDWHRNVDNYANDKLNLFAHNEEIISIVNALDPGARSLSSRIPGAFLVEEDELPLLDSLQLKGRHNKQLARLALAAVRAAGVDLEANRSSIERTLRAFSPLPHRLNPIAERHGLTFVDDGLSTTPISAQAALDTFSDSYVTILLGGYDRGVDYTGLARYVASNIGRVSVVTLPDSGSRIAAAIREELASRGVEGGNVQNGADLADAVRRAIEITPPGGIVLLSPAAPSFGAFRDYVERSAAFSAAVNSH